MSVQHTGIRQGDGAFTINGSIAGLRLFLVGQRPNMPVGVAPACKAVPNTVNDFFLVVVGPGRADGEQQRFQGFFERLSRMPVGGEAFDFPMQRQRIAGGPSRLNAIQRCCHGHHILR